MAAITQQYTNGSIGRMFARQNVPSVYGRQKPPEGAEPQATTDLMDQVSLSPEAPKPLTANYLEDALTTGAALATGTKLSEATSNKLREDRVFAAVSALALMGHDSAQTPTWPGGLPAPTPAELEAARRRLAQRPQNMDQAQNPSQVQMTRMELLEKLNRRDFGQLPLGISAVASAAS